MASFKDPKLSFAPIEVIDRLLGGRDPIGCPGLGPDRCFHHTDTISAQAADLIRGR